MPVLVMSYWGRFPRLTARANGHCWRVCQPNQFYQDRTGDANQSNDYALTHLNVG